MAKLDCPECGRHKSVSSGDYNGKHYKLCHACGWREVSDQAVLLWRSEAPAEEVKRDLTPHPPSGDMLVWLGRYGVSWLDFTHHGHYATRSRLLFKCSAFNALRACSPGMKPKWLTDVRVPLSEVSRHTRAVWGWWSEDSDLVVICEDSLGAFKAHLAGFTGFPLLGTAANRLDPRVLGDQKILVLTDPDDAGRMAGHKLQWRLRGLDVRVINGKEPKEYTIEELQQFRSTLWR